MTCRELSEFLQDYVAGELPTQVASEFSVHLTACDDCGVFVEQYRQTILLGRTALVEGDTAEVPEDLVRAIIAAVEGSR